MRSVRCLAICTAIVALATPSLATVRAFSTTPMTVARVVPLPSSASTSVAAGACSATLDDQTGRVSFSGTFAALRAQATSAQLHGPAAEGSGPAPVLVSAVNLVAQANGTFSGSGTLAPALVTAMMNGRIYCDVSDGPQFSAGEIRGQLLLVPAVPALGNHWFMGGIGFLVVALHALRTTSRRAPERRGG